MRSKRKPRLYDVDTSKTLRDRELIFKTFLKCMREGDHESAAEVLAASLSHMNKAKLARKYNIPRRTSYNLLQGISTPTLELAAKILVAVDKEAA